MTMADTVTLILDDSVFIDATSNCTFLNMTSGIGNLLTFNNTVMLSNTSCVFSHGMEPGTVMEFYGFTPPQDTDQTFAVTAGGSSVFRFEETYPEPNIGDLFYTSMVAGDSAIWTIDMHADGPLLFFDYAVTTVAGLESLQGQTIIVDDSNTEIQWQGNWKERRNYTLYGLVELNVPSGVVSRPAARPHGNGTHESDEVGDFFIFQFQGTSILVAGTAPLNRTVEAFAGGPVLDPPVSNFRPELNFTLDGHSQSAVFTNGGFPQPGGSPHFPYFRNDSLSEGNHTLIMTVNDVTGNASVIIDYLTYKPSFATVGDKPTFPPVTISNESTPTSSPSGTQSPDPTPGPQSNTGAIAGGVVGGIIFLALLALGAWLLYRKKQQARRLYQRESMNAPPTPAMSNLAVEPFVLPNPTESSSRKGTPSGSLQSPLATVPRTSKRQPQESTESEHSPSLISHTVSSPVEQHAELRRQRDELEETVHNLESQSQRGDTESSNQNFATQDQIREMQSRIDMLTREMGRYMMPPAYDSR
ncbi:hypothetical protein K435DRAFT_360116 [Dendrothele bispora CBS 962.96]|uniref:Epidermal growth factor receptor-like transmembrane-juxtamembrane segment domain-containing protein n=1 Tax=Dendrothele bispora (strain CBS 962.96) TaxID=1314807 RepID=A0A4S8MHY6_DENBC|nr:hypothetical protein K435DRAFT_360116 [Dendrothele bispora CBS 962.96]